MNSRLRAALRSKAQTISPVVMVGKEGKTEGVVQALNEALTVHELVKVRFQDFKDKVNEISIELEKDTKSTLLATTGFTAVYYRMNPDIRAYRELEVRYR